MMIDLVIIGGGAAGLSAGLYAARFKLNTVIIAKEFGGTGNVAHRVDNWIGEPGVSGFELMQKFIAHVKAYDIPMEQGEVVSVTKTNGTFTTTLSDGRTFESRTVIFTNGMVHKKLGVPGEEQYTGKGVHYCYTCDGPLFRNKVIAVTGGSDSAAQGALFLSSYGSKVYLIYRKSDLRAEPITVERIKQDAKIELVPSTNIVEIIGDGTVVKQLRLDTERMLDVDGLFIEIGHTPVSDMAVSLGVALDSRGFIMVNDKQETNVPGVLAAGDITNATTLKQLITSAAEGSIAAQTAYHSLMGSS